MLPREFTVNTTTVSIQQNLDYGHAGSVWDAALVWAHYLSKNYAKLVLNKIFTDKTILELGAGTGVSGLLLAAAFSPRQIILTDMPENIKLIRDNIECNQAQIPSDVKVNAASLLWGKENYSISESTVQNELISTTGNAQQPQVDIVLGSDLMYDDANTVKLLETIEELSQTIGKTALFIIVYCIRKESERAFVKILEEKYDSEYVQQSEFDPTYRDEDIGIIQFRRKDKQQE